MTKKRHYVRGKPAADLSSVTGSFEEIISASQNGYIRPFKDSDSQLQLYAVGRFGFFDADGNNLASSRHKDLLATQAANSGYRIFPLQ